MSATTEPITFSQANAAQRAVRRFASSGPGSWVFARVSHHLDRVVYRATDGRNTLASLLAGLPIVMLTTTGAKSGRPRTVPIVGLPTDEGLAVIASNYGQERHPAWYYNLAKNPEATAAVDDRSWRVRAVEAEGERRQRIWDEALKIYPGYSTYEKRAAHRKIHVFVLEPVA
ncbi:MAG: nitroreductase/quinone reductase family protein [Solirubrobacterales bacterium]|nr:nitroreductase family deazaflavin-dependent oxidoreductase [Solirubrobacterales bacterium]